MGSTTPNSELRTPNARDHHTKKPVLGLLGAIGSGKSTVAALLAQRGGFVLDADRIAHEALRDPEVWARIVERFGADVVGDDGAIDRRRLAAKVFGDEGARLALEALVHPWVKQRCLELAGQANEQENAKFIVLDAPVMLEAGWNDFCDRLIYVDVPSEVRLARIAPRGWTTEQLQAREAAQMSPEEKARHADAILNNAGSPEQTAEQLDELLQRWKLM